MSIFKVTTRQPDSSTVDFNSYNVIARDAEQAIKKATKAFVMKSEQAVAVACLGHLDVA